MKNVKNKMRMRKKKAFTLVELITAIGILVIVVAFVSVIFRTSIEGYRIATANGEIMHKLQTITSQLNRDFQNLPKDGYLRIEPRSAKGRKESKNMELTKTVEMDGIYYFTEGDFQSWFNPNYRSNIARVYFGHDSSSRSTSVFLNKCRLVRDTMLLIPIPSFKLGDSNNISYSQLRTDSNPFAGYTIPNSEVAVSDPNALDAVRRRMCEGVGELKIQWLKGLDTVNKSLEWSGASESGVWNAYSLDWPKAIKFTFTLYDSKGILKGGRTFTHIVYIGN